MEEIALAFLLSQAQDAFFTSAPICWKDPRYELRQDFEWVTKSPKPEKAIQVLKGCKGKGNPQCDERECMHFPIKNKAELRG